MYYTVIVLYRLQFTMSGEVVKAATVSGLRIEQVSGAVEASPNG